MATAATIVPEAATGETRSDGRLVAAHVDGDARAFDVLYRRYRNRLVQFCREQTGDRVLAEDLAQDTMIRYLEKADTFDTSRPIWPWLRTIARNLVIDHHRRRDEYLDVDASDSPLEDDAADATTGLDRIEARSQLGPVLAQLPVRQRTALRLRYGLDWTRREVADYFGIKPNACDQLLYRARENAREYLMERHDSPIDPPVTRRPACNPMRP